MTQHERLFAMFCVLTFAVIVLVTVISFGSQTARTLSLAAALLGAVSQWIAQTEHIAFRPRILALHIWSSYLGFAAAALGVVFFAAGY